VIYSDLFPAELRIKINTPDYEVLGKCVLDSQLCRPRIPNTPKTWGRIVWFVLTTKIRDVQRLTVKL